MLEEEKGAGLEGGPAGSRCLLWSHRCWSTRHPRGLGCFADTQLPCAKINIFGEASVFLSLALIFQRLPEPVSGAARR